MTNQQIESIRQIVEQNLEYLHTEIRELEVLTEPIPLDASIGRISRMDAINNKSINEASLRDKRKLVKRLEITIDRINDKDFGVCQKCGIEIPFGRLEFMPHTTRCVTCVG
ncbi:MAG: TraR/DksA family transcriptional regulator [Balneolaceae bacterium]